ncbi:MAG: hypothetical protein VX130_06190 [Verrucomicrobiota bacterium]|nr:hypothetical protein [Verrucomicrobiota bacterium]
MDISKVHVFEPKQKDRGAEVTIETTFSRKSFTLPKPLPPNSFKPIAVESFSIDPEQYFDLMMEVEKLHQK